MLSKIPTAWAMLRAWATDYQPALARTYVAVTFQMLAGLGIAVGDLPDKANTALGVVAVLATLIAGKSIQGAVYSPATHEAEVAKHRRAS
jgi:hypothetical protein